MSLDLEVCVNTFTGSLCKKFVVLVFLSHVGLERRPHNQQRFTGPNFFEYVYNEPSLLVSDHLRENGFRGCRGTDTVNIPLPGIL